MSDNAALAAALEGNGPVIPVVIRDELMDGLGAAPKFRLGLGLAALEEALAARGSRVIWRSGAPVDVLRALAVETGARAVHWNRTYHAPDIARDTKVKSALKDAGLDAVSHAGHLLWEPWTVETKTGGFYKVYTPFWKAARSLSVAALIGAPEALRAPEAWPASEALADWHLGAEMRRGASVVAEYARPGEAAAQDRLAAFVAENIGAYKDSRDRLDLKATSDLSEHLALGEIVPARAWHAAQRALEEGEAGAEHFMKELAWREFAYHLAWHTPRLLTDNWREGWDSFPWSEEETEAVRRWKEGRTGVEVVDAAMRELYVTGRMHNRARMIVASYLTKNLLTHWRVGLRWFEDCLIDWDPASNALGWQWTAGSGPDAAPYFRIYNPLTQKEKFDPHARYCDRWLGRGPEAQRYYEAVPQSWALDPAAPRPTPVVDLKESRARALAAYEARDF